MYSPDAVQAIIRDRQSIVDSSRRIARLLVGKDTIDHALQLEEIQQAALAGMTDEETAQYAQGFPWQRLAEDTDEDPYETLDELIHRPSSFIAEHQEILDVVEQAPMIATTRVPDVAGFRLGAILPVLTDQPLEIAAASSEGFLLINDSNVVKGEGVTSNTTKMLAVTIAGKSIHLTQSNFVDRHVAQSLRVADHDTAMLGESVAGGRVSPDLGVQQIADYLRTYAKAIKSMETLTIPQLQGEIEPHLQIGNGPWHKR